MKQIILALVLSLIAVSSQAATKYVGPSGAETWANCNSAAALCSPATAFSNAVAGDIVLFVDGTYTVPAQTNYELAAWRPASGRSGTAGSPITFQSLNQYGAHLVGTGTSSGDRAIMQFMIGTYQNNYIIFDGFHLTARNYNDTIDIIPGVRFQSSTGCQIINSKFEGADGTWGGAANNGHVFFEFSHYITVENNVFFDFRETNNNSNNAAVFGFDSNYITVKNNEFYDLSKGINFKDNVDDSTIQYNYFHDNYHAIWFDNMNTDSSCERNQVFHNVIANTTDGGFVNDDNPPNYGNDVVVYNNTFYDNSTSNDADYEQKVTSTGHHPIVYNNIIQRGYRSMVTDGVGATLEECDHNQWSGNMLIITNKYNTPTTYTSLVAWQNSGALDGGVNPGEGSLNSDPQFVNTSEQ